MLIRIQPCRTCQAKQYEPLDLDFAPEHVGDYYCYYTDFKITKCVENGGFHYRCPLFVNEPHKQCSNTSQENN